MANPLVKRFSLAFGKYFWIVPIPPLLGAAVGGFLAIQPDPPPSYTAKGVLSSRQQAVSFSETGAAILAQGQTLSEDILLGPDVVQNVAATLRKPAKEILKNATVKLKKSDGDDKGGGKDAPPAGTIEIAYKDDSPRDSVKAVNSLMTLMVEKSRQYNAARLKGIIQAIEGRLPDATGELRAAEQRLERYDRDEGAAILAVQNGSLVGAIAGSRDQQRQLRLQLEGVRAQVGSLESRLGLSVDEAYVSSALSSDPILAGLRAQLQQVETEYNLQSKRLRPAHPTMQELSRRQTLYSRLLSERAAEVLGGGGQAKPLSEVASQRVRTDSNLDPARQQLANLLVALKTQQETIERQLTLSLKSEQELRQEYASIPNKQLERDRLAQQVALKKALYDRMQAKLVDSKAAEAETVSSLAVAKPAEITEELVPRSPRAILMLAAGGAGGLVVALVLLLVLGILDGRFRDASEIRGALADRDIKLLGVVPALATDPEDPKRLPVMAETDAVAVEAYERCRSTLRRLNPRLQVLMLTGVAPGEGKSVVAYNLAIANARAGRRTLLLELDLRSPSAARAVGLRVDPGAAAEPFKYYENLGECVRLVPGIENLYLVPSPGPHPAAAALLESSELDHLLEDARSRFDVILIEATALSQGNDALLLEPKTDGTILVARPDISDKKVLGDRLDEFSDEETSTIKFLGVIIDATDGSLVIDDEDIDLDALPEEETSLALDSDRQRFEADLAAEFSLDRSRSGAPAATQVRRPGSSSGRSSRNGSHNGNHNGSRNGNNGHYGREETADLDDLSLEPWENQPSDRNPGNRRSRPPGR